MKKQLDGIPAGDDQFVRSQDSLMMDAERPDSSLVRGTTMKESVKQRTSIRSKKTIVGTEGSAGNFDKYAKEIEHRLGDVELRLEDIAGALSEKLEKGDYAVLASDKVTKQELASLLPDPEMQDQKIRNIIEEHVDDL